MCGRLPRGCCGKIRAAGWDVLAFEYIDSVRHADYRPGSPDLPRVIDAMHRLAAIGCPDLPVKQAPQRWAAYVDCEADLEVLDGDALLHTDFNPLNILVGPDRVWMIDWAWPTRGAARQAEALASMCPGWQQAPSAAIDVFALASARLYGEIARNDPQPFKQRLAAVTHEWHATASGRAAPSLRPRHRRAKACFLDHGTGSRSQIRIGVKGLGPVPPMPSGEGRPESGTDRALSESSGGSALSSHQTTLPVGFSVRYQAQCVLSADTRNNPRPPSS